jgi:hypothetical protein
VFAQETEDAEVIVISDDDERHNGSSVLGTSVEDAIIDLCSDDWHI